MQPKNPRKQYLPDDPVEWIKKIETEWDIYDKHNGYSIADAAAIQALYLGTASSDQQKRAINWIVSVAAKTHDLHYFKTDRDTTFSLGKGFVGSQIIKLSKLDTGEMEKLSKQP